MRDTPRGRPAGLGPLRDSPIGPYRTTSSCLGSATFTLTAPSLETTSLVLYDLSKSSVHFIHSNPSIYVEIDAQGLQKKMAELSDIFRPHPFAAGETHIDLYHVYDNLSRTPYVLDVGIKCEDPNNYIMNAWHVIYAMCNEATFDLEESSPNSDDLPLR